MRICRTCPALGGLFVTLFFVATAHANWPAEATSDGAPICTASGTQARLRPAVSDGYGGVLVAWEDWRSLSTTGPHPYAQRLNQNGDAVWTADGVALSAVSGRQQHVSCIADGIGGAFVAWADSVLGTACVQHLNAVGVPQWSPNGMLVTTDVSSSLLLPTLMLDGAGGVFVVWGGRPSGVRTLRMQRLNANGVRLWGPLGLQLATVFAWAYDGFSPVFQLLPDNTGGCIALWGSFDPALQLHAFAQRVTASGSPQWPATSTCRERFEPGAARFRRSSRCGRPFWSSPTIPTDTPRESSITRSPRMAAPDIRPAAASGSMPGGGG